MKRNTNEYRHLLAEWLLARNLDQSLREDQEAVRPAGHMIYTRRTNGWAEPKAGEVYILRPSASRSEWGPVYVLILKPCADSFFWATPFSRYPVPAVPGEMATDMSATPLRVLCLWNTREVAPVKLLDQPAIQAPNTLVDLANTMHQHLFSHAPQPAGLSNRTGPPMLHPADPRYEYLEEERCRLDEHLDRGAEERARVTKIISLADYKNKRSEWLLAAEGRPVYGSHQDEK